MEENMMPIKNININKEENGKVTITFTFCDNSEITLETIIENGVIVPFSQKDALICNAVDNDIIKIINSLVINVV